MAPGAARWKTPEVFPGTRRSWTRWPTRRILTTPSTPRGLPITGSDAPFDPAFLDIPAVNRALAEQF